MKLALTILLLLWGLSFSPKLKFKTLEKKLPIYIHPIKLTDDTDDSLSFILKDTLIKLGFIVVSNKEMSDLYKQYNQNLISFFKNNPYIPNTASGQRDYLEYTNRAYEMATPGGQRLTLRYAPTNDPTVGISNFDSIGFSYSKFPEKHSLNGSAISSHGPFMWSFKEVGTRSTDSVLSFLLKKL